MTIDVQPRPLSISARMAAEIRAEMARQRMSGRTIAARVGRSPNWVSLKTSGAAHLNLEDVEVFAGVLGVTSIELMRRASVPTHTYPRSDDLPPVEPELAMAGAAPSQRSGSPLASTYPRGSRPPNYGSRRPNGPRHAARTGR